LGVLDGVHIVSVKYSTNISLLFLTNVSLCLRNEVQCRNIATMEGRLANINFALLSDAVSINLE